MIDFHLNQAEFNLNLLNEQVGPPAVPNMPQTTNQAIIVIMRDLAQALRFLQIKVEEIGMERYGPT